MNPRLFAPALLATGMVATACVAPVIARPAQQSDEMQDSAVYAIEGGKVFTLAGAPIENATVLIRGGKVAEVGASVSVPSDAHVVDAKGLEVYPGLFDPITQMGLNEVSAVSATQDVTELGDYNPELVAATAINPSSAHIDVTRAAGITHVVSTPGVTGFAGFGGGGGVITGQATAINLSGWTIHDMSIEKSVAMIVKWPTLEGRTFDLATLSLKERPYTEVKEEYDRKVDDLSDLLERARHYTQAVEKGSPDNFERDIKLEALAPVIQGKLPLLVVAHSARDIRNAVDFFTARNLKMILAGGDQAWREKELLKQKGIPVILGPAMRLPDEEDFPYDKPMTQPSELYAAGIPIAFASFDTSFSRRLSQQAGNAVAYGLPYEEGLKAVTVNAAKMLGLADRLGTIEPGKMANIIVTNGDPLEIRTTVRYLFIAGRPTSLENKHLELYEEYSKRPKHTTP